MSRHGLLTGLCAASLSVALIAGCSSPVVPPTTAPTADNTNQLATTPVADASTGAPVTAAPAAVTPATLNGKATFRGEALSGYTVSVLDAQTGKPVELRADLAGATGLAVLNQNLMTDANGAFSIQVVGLKAGQALRVLVSKGNATLETVVTSNLTVLGAKKYLVLDAGAADGLTVDELTTSIAKIARGVIATTRLLTADEAAPILAKLSEQLNAISSKLSAALANNASLASSVIDGDKGDENVKALVKSAGVIADVNKTVAGLIGEIATGAKDKPVDPTVASDLAKIGYLGTDLDGALANGKITLTNRETGKSGDATGDTSNLTTSNSNSSSSHGGLTSAQTAALAAVNAVTNNPAASSDDIAMMDVLKANAASLGIDGADWTNFLALAGGSYNTASGRQQSVGKYLLERINEKKDSAKVSYTTLSALQTDFKYGIQKEADKRDMLTALGAASDAASVKTALQTYLPKLLADFKNYLTWHADWTVDSGSWTRGWDYQEKYFAQNISNLQFLVDTPSLYDAVADDVLAEPTKGYSDMGVLAGVAKGLVGGVNTFVLGEETALLTYLSGNRTDLGLDDADWTQLTELYQYARGGHQEAFSTSGRQKSVGQYLLERHRDRKDLHVLPYMSVSTLKSDFHYGVNKETTKWNMIIDVAAATDTASTIAALDASLPSIKADFVNYLTWHADWADAGAPWGSAYFQENVDAIGAYINADDAGKGDFADSVQTNENGVSDMRIFKGLVSLPQ